MSDKNSLDSLDIKRFTHTHVSVPSKGSNEPTYDNLAMLSRTCNGRPPHPALPPSGRSLNSPMSLSRGPDCTVSEYQEIGTCLSALPPEMEKVRAGLRLKNGLYRDLEFPADDRALYYSRAPSQPIVWKRPHEILRDKKRAERPHLFSSSRKFDLVQGELGDCWVVAALASISEVSELIDAIVPKGQSFEPDWYAGMFTFRFWRFGKWVTVVVDDLLPTHQNELLFVHSRIEHEFWGALVEKAYAKLVGSYEALKGGVLRDALTDFTGGVTECYSLDKPEAVSDKIINVIFKAFERQSLVGAEIRDRLPASPSLNSSTSGRVLDSGLVSGHSYTITDVRRVRLSGLRGGPCCEVTLVRVRNPWGQRVGWNGAWSEGSQEWLGVREAERQAVGVVIRDEGEFWMSWHDFITHFDVLDLCHMRPGTLTDPPPLDLEVPQWRCFEFSGRWRRSVSAGGRPFCRQTHWTNPQFLVRLVEADEDEEHLGTLIVCLMQKDMRRLRHLGAQLLAVGFAIYRHLPGVELPLPRQFFEKNNYVASCDFFINSRDVVKRFHLEPGDYVIIPSTYEIGQEGDFLLRIFVECQRTTAQLVEERLSLPPPSSLSTKSDPELTKKKENFRSLFYSIAGEAMSLDAFQLHRLFRLAGECEPYVTAISVAACKALVTLVDDPAEEGGATLRMAFPDMLRVWNLLYTWRLSFQKFDPDVSGSMEVTQLRAAIADNGYRTSPEVIYRLIHRYGDMNRRISFSDFVCCMCNLIKILTAFQTFKLGTNVSLTLEQLLEIALST